MSNWPDDCRRAVHLFDQIEIARSRENQVDDPFYKEHQRAIAQRINDAAQKAQKQTGPIRTRESPDSSKKKCHLRPIVCWASAKQARVFLSFFRKKPPT